MTEEDLYHIMHTRQLTMTDRFQRHGAQPTRRHWRKSQPVVAQQHQLGLFGVRAS